MTSETLADADFAEDTRTDQTFGDAVRGYLQRVRGGDMGSLPAVLGLIVLFVVCSAWPTTASCRR